MEGRGESSRKLISFYRLCLPSPRSCMYTMCVVGTGPIYVSGQTDVNGHPMRDFASFKTIGFKVPIVKM